MAIHIKQAGKEITQFVKVVESVCAHYSTAKKLQILEHQFF